LPVLPKTTPSPNREAPLQDDCIRAYTIGTGEIFGGHDLGQTGDYKPDGAVLAVGAVGAVVVVEGLLSGRPDLRLANALPTRRT
jgi:hypothetical protein